MFSFSSGAVRVRQARLEDLEYIAENIRPMDAYEAWAMSGRKPYSAVQISASASSIPYVLTFGTEPVAAFGDRPESAESGVIWLMGTGEISQIKFAFNRFSVQYLNYCLKKY